MALDATPGGPTANSYVTRAEAVAYMATRLYTAAWLALSTDDQDKSLMMATRLIDTNVCFTGVSTASTQALRWPMQGMTSPQGYAIGTSTIPAQLKDAVSELARLLASADYTAPSDAEVQGLTKLKAGPVELQFKELFESRTIPSPVLAMIPATWLCPTWEDTQRVAEFKVL